MPLANFKPDTFKLQACLNGNRRKTKNLSVPETPEQLALDALSCVAAGAEAFHFHPRDEMGEETLHPDDVSKALLAVRKAVPDLPVGIGTGYWISPKGKARHKHINDWHDLPDYISLNMNEEDHRDVYDLVSAKGIGVEVGIWTAEDVSKFIELPKHSVTRILVEVGDQPIEDARTEALEILQLLEESNTEFPVLLHGDGESAWPMIELAASLNLSTRAGYEDMHVLPSNIEAPNNADIITAAKNIMGF